METVFYAHGVNVIGGAERVTLATINGMKGCFHTRILCPDGGVLGEAARAAGADVSYVSCRQPDLKKPLQTARQLWEYVSLIRRFQPKLVHVGDLLMVRSLQLACQITRTPLICHAHFPYESSFSEWVFKNRPAPAAFIFCSQELKDNIGPKLNALCPHAKQVVIHNGIDTDYFKPSELPAQNSKPRIGIIANLQKRKGHDEFLQMAKILTDRGLDLQFDIIGGDILQEPREPYLRKLAEELGISDRVVFHGQISDVREELLKLDIVVCASHEEAFPISILEAMACGKPIVSTNVNGIPEAIVHSECGLLVDPFKPEQLAEKVQLLVESEDVKGKLAQAAVKRVESNFSREMFNKKVLGIYESL